MERTRYVCDCGREYTPRKKYNDSRVKCSVCIRNTHSWEVKARAIKHLGGKCKDCHYTGHPVAFDFDHKDPTQKEFKISGKYIFRWKELVKELDKCELRCSNCHRTRHYLLEFPESGSILK
jgi:hypothetical protein